MSRIALAIGCLLVAACGGRPGPLTENVSGRQAAVVRGDRGEADRRAKEEFRRLHFFAEGRGMILAPGVIGAFRATRWTRVFDGMLRERWGLLLERGQPVGLHEVEYRDMRLGVAGCAMCHTGRAAGQTLVGLGNKNFDIARLGEGLGRIERAYAALTPADAERRETEAFAQDFVRHLADRERGNLTQGMVPVSLVLSWFYHVAGEPVPREMTRGAVKIPALWGYGEKRRAGQFCDGYGDWRQPGWAVQVELTAGQKPETVRRYVGKIHAAEELLDAFLPPAYPFSIDRRRAAAGARVFAQNCRRCHGDHRRDEDGLPVYAEPRLIPWGRVGTDPDRLEVRVPSLNHRIETSPLRDLIGHTSHPPGYFAPRLDGIWARFPYLHNGSVPSVAALLAPVELRPAVFSLEDAGERARFDETNLGLTVPAGPDAARLLRRGDDGDRRVYDVRRIGHSNAGHEFGTELPDAAKGDLIEYLKTL